MATGYGGKVYTSQCILLDPLLGRKPTTGFKKRAELKAKNHSAGDGTIWKTYSGEFSSLFDTPNPSVAAILTLTF